MQPSKWALDVHWVFICSVFGAADSDFFKTLILKFGYRGNSKCRLLCESQILRSNKYFEKLLFQKYNKGATGVFVNSAAKQTHAVLIKKWWVLMLWENTI